jgi:beta-galactosidase
MSARNLVDQFKRSQTRGARRGGRVSLVRSVILGSLAAVGSAGLARAAGNFVWLEGESPTRANVEAKPSFVQNGQFLSEGKWLQLSAEPGEVEKKVPGEGAVYSYEIAPTFGGKTDVWARAGFEFARTAFEWRVGNGEWKTVSPDEVTTDLTELGFFCEIGWLKLGQVELKSGEKTLVEIRVPRSKNEKGEIQRVLFGLDAMCLAPATANWKPHSRFRPDQDPRTDEDKAAEKAVFKLPAAAGSGRATIELKGTWEIARDDEPLPGPVAEAIKQLPDRPVWQAVQVPGDKYETKPELGFAHRVWYRTRVEVPAGTAGGYFLDFPLNSLNTTVYVNGKLCGFNKNPLVPHRFDISSAVKPGQVNEILVGIKDAWYGYKEKPGDPMKLRRAFNLPREFLGRGFQDFAYPLWNHPASGILMTPTLTATGGAYASDVYVNPQVGQKQLAVEISVQGTSSAAEGTIEIEAVNPANGSVEKKFPAVAFKVGAGETTVVKAALPFEGGRLWWPEDPQMYHLRTTVKVGGKVQDVTETPFGYREWAIDGTTIKLNGVRWNGRSDTVGGIGLQETAAFVKKSGQSTYRIREAGVRAFGVGLDAALNVFDKAGVPIRLEGILDGQAIGYHAMEQDEDLKKLYGSDLNVPLMQNTLDHMVANVKAHRNHPSMAFWTIDNEFMYINVDNLHAGSKPEFWKWMSKIQDAVHAVNPQAMVMTDGLGAGSDNARPEPGVKPLDVHGDHYLFGSEKEFGKYPLQAYDMPKHGGKATWDGKRPRFSSEDYYAAGINPFDYAYFGGEECFGGKTAVDRAEQIVYDILAQGYRWHNMAAYQLFLDRGQRIECYKSLSPVAAFVKEWDNTWGSGQTVTRTVGVFNDTSTAEPIVFEWTLNAGGKTLGSGKKEFARIDPGQNEKFPVEVKTPNVSARTEAEWTLTVTKGGKEAFKDVKKVSILPPTKPSVKLAAADLLVLDPKGETAKWLKARGVAFTEVPNLAALRDEGRVLVVGRDALSEKDASSTRLAAYAAGGAGGRRVVVLEQEHPLKFAGLGGAEMETDDAVGRIAFVEDAGHPVARNLASKDFFTWDGAKADGNNEDQVVYRRAYLKPARGARSLVQCEPRLANTALVEVPVGEGILLLSQLAVGEKLEKSATAQTVLANLVDYAAAYKLEYRDVTAVTSGSPQLDKTLGEIALKYSKAGSALDAIKSPGKHVAVIAATPENLSQLASNLQAVNAYTDAGGWIVLQGLTPEGLSSFNKVVGVEHLIRKFTREKVTLPPSRSALLAGVGLADVVLYSSKPIFSFAAGNYVADDAFSYVVDIDDVAPFATSSFGAYANVVNNFVPEDGWPLIIDGPRNEVGNFTLKLPRPERIVEYTHIACCNYQPTTELKLTFDGKDAVTLPVKPDTSAQTFTIDPPRQASEIHLEITKWEPKPNTRDLVGIGNIYIKAYRSPEFYAKVKPLLNIGALVEYPRGNNGGGILLSNINLKETEEVPANYTKKRYLFSSLLRNLKAPFSGGKTVIVGANLAYEPISIGKYATQFRTDRGWFGDKATTFAALPTGKQKFAGVQYDVYEFKTSPVPEAIMLRGDNVPGNLPEEVKGIPVNRMADALFFLQTARIDQELSREDREQKKQYELAKYIVHYKDGKTVEIPLIQGVHLASYRQKAPEELPGASLGWTSKYEGRDESAVAYSMQWTNPRPEVEIESIDFTYGKDRRAVPVLLAITAAKAP